MCEKIYFLFDWDITITSRFKKQKYNHTPIIKSKINIIYEKWLGQEEWLRDGWMWGNESEAWTMNGAWLVIK